MQLSTGDSVLDDFFGGGLYPGQVTEIYGASGTGKTSFAQQLALQVQLSYEKGGLEGSCIYIATSSRFRIDRVSQIKAGYLKIHPELEDCLDHLYVFECIDIDTQTIVLKYQLPNMMKSLNCKLLVIDSIAPHFRSQDEGEMLTNPGRALLLFEIGEALHTIASLNDAVVLILNEVTANFPKSVRLAQDTHGESIPYFDTDRAGYDCIAALGVSGSVISNSRIRFHKRNADERKMVMDYCPQAPNGTTCNFVLDSDGIRSSLQNGSI